jgi:putative ABC transport system substrate-binding protein
VFVNLGDPVASGLVERLDRPSGNATGFAAFAPSLAGKWLELLSEIAPGLKRAAIMFYGAPVATEATVKGIIGPYMHSFETAARCSGSC